MPEYYAEQIQRKVDVDPKACYIGVDFGTTNSTLSYLQIHQASESNVRVDTVAYRESVDQTEYIPTVVAYNVEKEEKEDYTIGRAAKRDMGKKNTEGYDCFKLQLGKNFKKPLREGGKTAEEVTRVYLDELLKKFKNQMGVSTIDKIVATIPETWFREDSNRIAREHIRGIYEELGYSREQIQLQSEPVAACAYYCWCYFEKMKRAYNGHIMIVDYGGGTLDVTLCQVSGGFTIKVLERCGAGEYRDTNGCAGVAFDEAVTKEICRENGLELDGARFSRLRNRFEQEKITRTDKVEKFLREGYYIDENLFGEESVFQVEYNEEDLDVKGKYLGQAFQQINAVPLAKAVEQMKAYFPAHQVDETDGNVFQVLLIGGFSNYYGVEHVVRQAFGVGDNLHDKTFGTFQLDGRELQILTRPDRSLAVSKGAALIAADVISVDPTCPYNIWMRVWKSGSANGDFTDVPLLKKGMSLKNSTPQFFGAKFEVMNPTARLRMFLDNGRADGEGMIPIRLNQDMGAIFPNIQVPGNLYSIGVSMDSDMVAFLHIKDSQEEKKISLQELLEPIAIRMVED